MTTDTTMTSTEALGILAALGIGILFICLAVWIISVIAYWKMFKKMGEPGWKAIIPIYNTYIQFKHTWAVKYFWIAIIASFIGGILQGMGENDGGDPTAAFYIGSLLAVVGTIVFIISMYKLSKAFGHGVGFFIGLLFLTLIFMLILGFGSSQYIGPNGREEDLGYTYAKPEKSENQENKE